MPDPSCVALFFDCLIGVVAGIGLIVCCWRLWSPVNWARKYDATITEERLYTGLPIYGYLRRYLLVMLFVGFVAVLTTGIVMVETLFKMRESASCNSPDWKIANLILALLGIHMPTIIWFETIKRRRPSLIQRTVDEVGKRLWGVAVLLVATGLLYFVAAWVRV